MLFTSIAGPCDRRAAHTKAAIKRYINEGHDVTTAEEMKKVFTSLWEQSVTCLSQSLKIFKHC